MSTIRDALLVLADGTTFEGEAIGADPADGIATGEVVFNTALTGYQEIISDPSYAGQIITFTYPHIGNYGVTPLDDESRRPFARGVIVRELARRRSSWRAEGDLDGFLRAADLPGIADEQGRPIAEGEPAHLVVFDPAREWTVDPSKLASRSRNTPYAGRTVRGKVLHTLLHGQPTVLDGEAQR